MLNTILVMPPVFSANASRRLDICTSLDVTSPNPWPSVYWPSAPLNAKCLTVGASVEQLPNTVYKAIHISQDDNWVFETVFSMDGGICICLYTKLISANSVEFGIALNTIFLCQGGQDPLRPLSIFVEDPFRTPVNHLELPNFFYNSITSNIVPPVFGERSLWSYINCLADEKIGGFDEGRIGWKYKPLYDFAPSIVEALMNGSFHRSPFKELGGSHPLVDIRGHQWFMYEEIAHAVNVKGFESIANDRAFDEMALAIAKTSATEFTISSRLSDTVDGNDKLWLIREYRDDYQGVLCGSNINVGATKKTISEILFMCVKVYCEMYGVEPTTWWDDSFDQSSITIRKNLLDEISIEFQDFKKDRFITFYHSLPALMMSTLSVGFDAAWIPK